MIKILKTLVKGVVVSIIGIQAQEVVFVDPVVNLCSKQLSAYGKATQAWYDEQPFSDAGGPFDCLRTAQALFNETATVIAWDKNSHELCVEFPHLITEYQGIPIRPRFWCWDSHVVPKEKMLRSAVGDANYITLQQLWHDASHARTYSAGTRFVRVPEKDTDLGYGILLYVPELKKNSVRIIPKHLVVLPDAHLSCDERRRLCKHLVQTWARGTTIIPYVWGGASYTMRLPDHAPKKKHGFFAHHPITFWVREPYDPRSVYGFDCSSLILRAAQIFDIPYFFKTSYAAYALGHEIENWKDVREGDIVAWPGHMFMISDVKKGLLIESKGYDAGFGQVQEVHLSTRLQNIASYQQLFNRYKQGMPLLELDSQGNVIKVIPLFKIISLCGCC